MPSASSVPFIGGVLKFFSGLLGRPALPASAATHPRTWPEPLARPKISEGLLAAVPREAPTQEHPEGGDALSCGKHASGEGAPSGRVAMPRAGRDGGVAPAAPEALGVVSLRRESLAAVSALGSLAVFPESREALVRVLAARPPSLEAALSVLAADPLMCLNVLALGNSLLARRGLKAFHPEAALQVLGLRRVRQACEDFAVLGSAAPGEVWLDLRPLLEHSLAVACISRRLSEVLGIGRPGRLYLAGLGHDVGKFVLHQLFPGQYCRVLQAACGEAGSLEEAERRLLGVTHLEAGAAYAGRCGLSALLGPAIEHHVAPEGARVQRAEVALVSIANFLAKAGGLGFSGDPRMESEYCEVTWEGLEAWSVLMAETGRRQDVSALRRSLAPLMQSLGREAGQPGGLPPGTNAFQ